MYIVTCAVFPDLVQHAMFCQEAWTQACQEHDWVEDPPQLTLYIQRLVTSILPTSEYWLTLKTQLDQHGAQVLGELKVAAHLTVVQGFSLGGLTPADKMAKVLTLIGKHMFQLHYENIDEVCHFVCMALLSF